MAHKCIIAKISAVEEIPGADKIHVAIVLGEKVVVAKEWGVDHIGVFFPVDVQLSEEYCRENNLFRDATKNKDNTKKGFFESNRRVRAQPFLGVKSEGYFAAFESIAYTGVKVGGGWPQFTQGYEFDELNGHKICQKYFSEQTKVAKVSGAAKQAKKNYAPLFEKHVDSEQFKHYAEKIPAGALLHFHSKKHGTSFRVAKTKVSVDLPWWKLLMNKVHPIFPDWKWGNVVGTRNIVLQDATKVGFHGSEQYRFDVLAQLAPHLENGVQIFGEIVGYVNGKPIMPNHDMSKLRDKRYTDKYGKTITYSYGCKEHEFKWHIYRVAHLLEDGSLFDLSQKQLEKWCAQRNLPHTLEVHDSIIYDGDVEKLRELVEELTERPEVLCEDYTDPTMISEGIIIRIEDGGITPRFMKSKSYAFRCMESLCEAADPEGAS